MVVDDHDAMRAHRDTYRQDGVDTRSCRDCSMVRVAPSSPARSRIDVMPTPGRNGVPAPALPSSVTSSCRPPLRRSRMAQCRAPECRAALPTASMTIRYAAVSTAGVSCGEGRGAVRVMNGPDPRALIAETCCGDRRHEPVVEGRRPQRVGQSRGCSRTASCSCARSCSSWASTSVASGGQGVPGEVDLKNRARKRRTELVVQVAPQPTPDLLLRRDQSLTRRLQLQGHPGRVDDRAGVPGQLAEQTTVGGGQFLARSSARRRGRRPTRLGRAAGPPRLPVVPVPPTAARAASAVGSSQVDGDERHLE